MIVCKGECDSIKINPSTSLGSFYGRGLKRCRVCDCFFDTRTIKCECCNGRLRTKPRSSKVKKMNQEMLKRIG